MNKSRFSFELRSFLLFESLVPVGLRLVSRVFFDLDSDLEEPRITLEIFCIVRSPMDSVLFNFGEDLAGSVFNESKEEAEATEAVLEVFSSLNELDFLRLEAISLLNAPNSWARFFTTLDSGLGFNTEVSEDEIEVTVEVMASFVASSPSSSGMVG